MTIPNPVEFWTFDNTLKGVMNSIELSINDEITRYVDPYTGSGKAWAFDGTLNSILTASLPSNLIVPGNSLCVSFWFRFTTTTPNGTTAILDISATNRIAWYYVYKTTTYQSIRSRDANNTAAILTPNDAPKNTNWHHVLLSYDVITKNCQGWLDGTRTQGITGLPNGSLFAITEPASLITIGADAAQSISNPPMEIDSLGIWTEPLGADHALELYGLGNDWSPTPQPEEITYSIQNIQQIDTTIENGSITIKCGGSGGFNLIVKHLSKNPSELTINNIQDKFDNKFDDPNYYWTKQNG